MYFLNINGISENLFIVNIQGLCAMQTMYSNCEEIKLPDMQRPIHKTHKQRQMTEMRKAKGLDVEKPKTCHWI